MPLSHLHTHELLETNLQGLQRGMFAFDMIYCRLMYRAEQEEEVFMPRWRKEAQIKRLSGCSHVSTLFI